MRENQAKAVLLGLGTVFVLAFTLLPVGWMLAVSFGKEVGFAGEAEFHFTIRNYVEVLRRPSLHFVDFLRNSLLVAGSAAVAATLIGSLGAYGISRVSFRGRLVVLFVILALSMFPQISIVGYLFKLMTALEWTNTYRALILPYTAMGIPIALWVLLGYFSQIPRQLDEAAQMDGAGRAATLFRVILPVSLPGLLSAGLLVFILLFNEFLFALMLTTDAQARTVPVGIALFEGLHGEIPWGHIMAASAVSSFPAILLALCAQRYITTGLTAGTVK